MNRQPERRLATLQAKLAQELDIQKAEGLRREIALTEATMRIYKRMKDEP